MNMIFTANLMRSQGQIPASKGWGLKYLRSRNLDFNHSLWCPQQAFVKNQIFSYCWQREKAFSTTVKTIRYPYE